MDELTRGQFSPGVRGWIDGLGSVRDAVRQALVFEQLQTHLPAAARGLEVLDAGCGQGTQAILLARVGHRVTGIDSSRELLAEAERARREEPAEVARRLCFRAGDVLDLGDQRQGSYDVVCCHGVAMYLPSLAELSAALVSASRPGG